MKRSFWRSISEWIQRHRVALFFALSPMVAYAILLIASPDTFDERLKTITAIATILGALGLFLNLIFTSDTVENSRKALALQASAHQETQRHQTKSQQDDRFFKAAEMLGRPDSPQAWIAALYALEQLAEDSSQHYNPVMETICAFVRERSQVNRPTPEEVDALAERYEELLTTRPSNAPRDAYGMPLHPREQLAFPKTTHEIDVAMRIIGRRRQHLGRDEQRGLDLSGANLCGMGFRRIDLQGAKLENALLVDAHFLECNLAYANLRKADLRFSSFARTLLNHANLESARAQRAGFFYADRVPDPTKRIAHQSGEDGMSIWSMLDQTDSIEDVQAGRCMDDSYWGLTVFGKTQFTCSDLSGMRGLREGQRHRMLLSDELIQPVWAPDGIEVEVPFELFLPRTEREDNDEC